MSNDQIAGPKGQLEIGSSDGEENDEHRTFNFQRPTKKI